jgi:membrane dipeptidase
LLRANSSTPADRLILPALHDRSRTKTPILDGHIDLPEFARMTYKNNISAFDLNEPTPGHVDIPRLREGQVGGFFWSCFTQCPADPKGGVGSDDFLTAHNAVRGAVDPLCWASPS